jgi:hypothetical protein
MDLPDLALMYRRSGDQNGLELMGWDMLLSGKKLATFTAMNQGVSV